MQEQEEDEALEEDDIEQDEYSAMQTFDGQGQPEMRRSRRSIHV